MAATLFCFILSPITRPQLWIKDWGVRWWKG